MQLLRRALVGVAAATLAVTLVTTQAHAATYDWSAEMLCAQGQTQVLLGVGGETGQEFDLHVGNIDFGTHAAGSGVASNVGADGAYHVVAYVADTQTIAYETTVYVACEFPYITFNGECQDDGGHLVLLIAQNQGYTFNVYVDDELVDGFEHITDTEGQYADLGHFANGQHSVDIRWFDGEIDIDDTGHDVTLDCAGGDAGSGAGIPDTGADTAPLLAIGGVAIALGAVLLSVRRIRTA